MKFKYFITNNLDEVSAPTNIGFHEMTQFYQEASDSEIKKMEKIIKNEDWEGFKRLIKKTIGTELQ